MDSPGGSRNYERFIAFNLEKPPSNDLGSDTIYQRKVRPASRPRLLSLFPLTPADEPAKKKRFFRQEGLPMSKHNPATDLPRKCESFIPFSPEKVPHDRGSDKDPLRLRPMLLCMFPLTPAGEERRQMSMADQGRDVINRSDSNGLGSLTQDLCASPSLEETTSGHPLRGTQFVDPSDIPPRETDQHLQAPTEVPHFGPEPTNLLNAREVVPFEPESMNLLNWASNGSRFPSPSRVSGENVPHGSGCPLSCTALIQKESHLTRRLRASRQRTVICAQPVRAMSNNNTILLAKSPAQSAQPPAQPRALLPAQPRVLPRAQPLVRTLALRQDLAPAQPQVPAPAQPSALPLTEPRARRQAQPRVQSPAQPRAQAPAQPRAQPQVQPRAQPGAQAPTQPRAQRGARPQVQPPAQAPALARTQHGPRPKSSRYKGVTHYKRTGRWEAHLWDDGYQIYLGASLTEIQAARAYDRAAIRFRGVNAEINFLLADYRSELPQLQAITEDKLVKLLRKQSAGKGTLYPEYPNL